MWLFLGNVEVSFKFMCVHYHEHIVIDGFPMDQWVGYKHNKEGLLLIIETNQTKPKSWGWGEFF